MAHPGAPKEVVEGRSRTRRRGRFAEDHWQSLKALDPFATTFPANSRTGRYVRDARFVSSAPPIVLVGNRAGRRKSRLTIRDPKRVSRRQNRFGLLRQAWQQSLRRQQVT